MSAARDALVAREARLARHCREGSELTRRDPAYLAVVVARLRPELDRAPDDLWSAIPWIWTVTLGGGLPAGGALRAAVAEAAVLLREWLSGDAPLEALDARWSTSTAAELGLGSTLRSHPFADLRAWSLRPPSAA
jgi:hypothetical protein